MLAVVTLWCYILSSALPVSAQAGSSLAEALAGLPNLSTFRQLVNGYPSVIDSLVSNSTKGVTVLAPSDQAFLIYTSKNGPWANLSLASLTDILSYHILAAPLTSANFTSPKGLTVPTLLKDQQYNNRTPDAELAATYGANATGQVLFVQQQLGASAKLKVRQHASGVGLQAGLSQTVNMTLLDSNWALGIIQTVDGCVFFFLFSFSFFQDRAWQDLRLI
jgi:hypothetical protein